MSHTANTRPLAIRIPAHYSWMKMRSGEYPFRALDNCPAGDSFRSLKICLQQLPVDCCAFFRPHFGGCSGCCRTAIVRKTSYTVYRTMYSPPSSGSGKAVAYKLYLYIHKCACTVGGLRSRPSLLIRIWILESFTDQKKIFYRKNRSRISFDTLLLRSVNFLPCLVQIQQNQIQFSNLFP